MTARGNGSAGRPSLLAVAALPVWQMRDGFSLRVANLLRGLAREWRVTLIAPLDEAVPADPAALGLERLVPVSPEAARHSPRWDVDAEAFRKAVDAALADARPDAALVWGGAEFAALGRRDFPPVVLDRIDCMALAAWRELGLPQPLRHRASVLRGLLYQLRRERRFVRAFAACVVAAPKDAAVLRRISGRDTVHVVPNGVEIQSLRIPADEAPGPTVAFTGVMAFPPNVDAVHYFVKSVWPAVRASVPDARFVIAGRHPTPEVARLAEAPGVEVLGEVPDMTAVLRRAWVAVAPMRTGAGIKNKVLEAWAVGTPVVMSPAAANGLSLDPAAAALVEEEPARMAEVVARLLRDTAERRRLGAAAHAFALEHAWEDAAREVSRLLRTASGRPA
ncbi:MAG TPA: glycosyltransferase family 4 protein [Gemmatimonadales bacterium]